MPYSTENKRKSGHLHRIDGGRHSPEGYVEAPLPGSVTQRLVGLPLVGSFLLITILLVTLLNQFILTMALFLKTKLSLLLYRIARYLNGERKTRY